MRPAMLTFLPMSAPPQSAGLALVLLTAFCLASAALAQTAPASFDATAKAATAAREAGKAEEAIEHYRRAVQLRPNWQEGWWYLGTLQYDADRYTDAIPALQELLQLAPAAGPAWNFLGLCEFETKDYANALTHLEKGQRLGASDDPEIARVSKYHLALLLNRNGEFERATAMLASAFGQSQFPEQVRLALGLALLRAPVLPEELDPSQDALVHAAGEAATLAVRGDSPKALDAFGKLVRDYPSTPYLRYSYGKALAAAVRNEEALAQQREETRLSPQSELPQIEISLLELRLQHTEDALRAAEKAVRLAPHSQATHRALEQSLQAAGKEEEAAAELAAAEKLAPERPLPDQRIARLYTFHSPASSRAAAPPAANGAAGSSASFDELVRRAAASQAAGDSSTAIENYEQALQLRPEWEDGRWSLAMLWYSSGRYPQAISALRSWVERKPTDGTAWAVLGLSEFALKDYDNALIHLQRGQDLGLGGGPESMRLARYHLAILLNRNGQHENAMDLLAPEGTSGSLASQIQFALGMALLRIALLPEQVQSAQHALVKTAGEIAALLHDSKYDQAFPKFRQLLEKYPAAPFLHYAYGTALASISQYDEADIQLLAETRISPASELPYIRLASIALRKHRAADALPYAQHAVQCAPDSASAHYVLGRAFLELGQQGNAVRELEQASKLNPGSPEVHFNLARAYARSRQQEQAKRERAIFARLNALAEQQRSLRGNQSYEGPRDALDLSASPTRPPESGPPEPP
jgi:tetratricopeptide (TPR) repeat protein